jgi:hypothetical protein
MYYLIYKTTNKLNNKIYVGKHKTENKNDDYLGSGMLLERAIEKYGSESFIREILLDLPTEEEMNQKEADIVDEDFIARDDTYNIKLGGHGGWEYVNKMEHSLAGTRRFQELLNTDASFKEEWRTKISNSNKLYQSIYGNRFKGRKHTEETKRFISEKNHINQSGKKNSQYGKHWITDGKESRSVKKELPIPEGWRKGRV